MSRLKISLLLLFCIYFLGFILPHLFPPSPESPPLPQILEITINEGIKDKQWIISMIVDQPTNGTFLLYDAKQF